MRVPLLLAAVLLVVGLVLPWTEPRGFLVLFGARDEWERDVATPRRDGWEELG